MGTPLANKVALHIARSIGTLYIGEAIVSLQAPGFLHVRDKKALLLSRIIVRSVFSSFFSNGKGGGVCLLHIKWLDCNFSC